MKTIILLLILFLTHQLFADFKKSQPVGPGVVHHHDFREAGPWHIHVLEIDITNPWISLETAKAQDRVAALERTSSMSLRNNSENHTIIGGINGDFYDGSGIPIGAMVRNGVLVKQPYPRSVFGISFDKSPLIDIVQYQGLAITPASQNISINGINKTRSTDYLVLYNSYFGTTTGTNQWGTEVIVEYVSESPAVNDTILVRVVGKDSTMATGTNNNIIPANGFILSGHGTAANSLNSNVFLGDTLAVVLSLTPGPDKLTQLVGGTPRIIRNGVVSVEWSKEDISQSFATDRHPRTAVGINADSSKIFLFTVDGRQGGYSVGVSLYELADIMLGYGVDDAVNLDGGGSTTMVLRNEVANSPSDPGGERSVSNSLLVVSSAPLGPLAHLSVNPDEAYLMHSTQLQFSAEGFDEFYNPVNVDANSLSWSADANIGSINVSGLFSAGTKSDSGYVVVSSGDIRDSAMVYITTIGTIKVLPNPVVLEVGQQQSMTAETRDSYGNLVELAPAEYTWKVQGDVGTIASRGMFTATQTGIGKIIATYDSVSGSADVKVGVVSESIIDDFSTIENWTVSGLRIDLDSSGLTIDSDTFVSEPSSGKLTYLLQTGGTSVLYLDCNLPVSGTPIGIGLHVYGDGKAHWLRGEFTDGDGEKFLINFTEENPGIDWLDSWKYLEIPLDEAIPHWSNGGAILNFPITWTKIYLAEGNEDKKDSGVLYLDDFKAIYLTTSVEKKSGNYPNQFKLDQNYPNPFNPETTIGYSLPRSGKVMLEIFDLAGQKVDTLVDDNQSPGSYEVNWQASNLASSIYFYRLSFDTQIIATRKMVVVK